MKLFVFALVIVCGIAAALYGVGFLTLSPFLEQSDAVGASKALAGLPILSFPKLLEVLEQREGRKNLADRKWTPIYTFGGFQIAWPLMALYGWLLLFAVDIISDAFVVGVDSAIAAEFEGDLKEKVRGAYELALTLLVNFPPTILCAYYVGRWIGTRCSSRGMAAVLLVMISYIAFNLAIYPLAPPDEPWEPPSQLLNFILLPFLICAGLLGYWRGQKYKLAKYLHYLLAILPAQTRDTVVSLAFDEAQRIASPVTERK
jgi:hypothetical protein